MNNQSAAFHDNPYALFHEYNHRTIYQWNVFSGDVSVDLPYNLEAGVRVNGNIRGYKLERERPSGSINFRSNYRQDQSSLIDLTVHKLDDGVIVRLADHIHYSVIKSQKNISTPNLMLNEIRQFYPKEYDIGRQAIQLVDQRFQSNLDENEAGFVTFHIVSSESQEGPVDFHEMLEVLKMIITTIEDYFQLHLDTTTFDYSRLVTHLKFFIQRMLLQGRQTNQSLQGDSLYEMLVAQYPQINQFLNHMNARLLLDYNYELTDSDRMYLIIHLARLLKNRS